MIMKDKSVSLRSTDVYDGCKRGGGREWGEGVGVGRGSGVGEQKVYSFYTRHLMTGKNAHRNETVH